MAFSHTEDCVHSPRYQGSEECAPNVGDWNQPQGWFVEEAKADDVSGEAPWCRIRERAWHLQEEADK